MRHKRSKRKDQQRHARLRAQQRFGLNITAHQQDEIVGKIQRNEAEIVRKDSNRVSVFDVEFQEETLRVAYDRHRKSIATIMTREFE